jgi:hypothetical protein
MQVRTANKMLQIQTWAAQVIAFKQSGQTVKQWCKENGVAKKSFYYHRKKVQEEILEEIESGDALPIAEDHNNFLPVKQRAVVQSGSDLYMVQEKPEFAALPRPQVKAAVVTVRLSEYAVDIQNGADDTLIEQVLRVVSRL